LTDLLLKRAATSRSGGEWNEDDYDVLADGDVVGRIYRANAVCFLKLVKRHRPEHYRF
jgi:hypothetical protein